MASVSNGTYWIVNAANTDLRLDVYGGSNKVGANVQVWTANVSNAQVFHVKGCGNSSYPDDKVLQSRYSGLVVRTSGTAATGSAITDKMQVTGSNAFRPEMFHMVDANSTVTIGGVSYPTFFIVGRVTDAENYVLGAADGTSGSDVKGVAKGTANTQKWAFVPVPSFVDGGVYEIRSSMDPKMCLDVSGASKNSGANVILYASNGNNNQKFAIYKESDGYSIRAMHSDMFVDVNKAEVTKSGTNVQQWPDNDTRAQRWAVTTYGTQVYNGVECVVVEFGAGNQNTCLLDVTAAKTTNNTNIQIYSANHTYSQKFLLYPSDLQDPLLPVPSDIRFASNEGQSESAQDGDTARLSVRWTAPSSWSGLGGSYFEHRIRTRTMGTNGVWSVWGDYGAWEASLVTMSGTTATLVKPLSYVMDSDRSLGVQWQVQVRCVTSDTTKVYPANMHGAVADALLSLYCEPKVTFKGASWSPLCLSVTYESDWVASNLRLLSSSQWHKEYTFTGDASGTMLIPSDSLIGTPEDGDDMVISYRSGTAYRGSFKERKASVSVTKVSTPLTAKLDDDAYAVRMSLPGSGEKHVWLGYGGNLYEVEEHGGTYDIPYPMGSEYDIYASVGGLVSVKHVDATNVRMAAWSLDGRSLYAPLVIRESLSREVEQESEQRSLDSRAELSVDFGPTRTTTISVGVRLYGLDGEATLEEMRSLVGRHCLFRAPDGGVDEVAVGSIGETYRVAGVYDLSVSMTREVR